jgi:hypothetical protein
MRQTIQVTPKPNCKQCKGWGLLPGDSVPMPFGSGFMRGPDEYCDCVLDQVPDYDIQIVPDSEVLKRHNEALAREAEFFAQAESEES